MSDSEKQANKQTVYVRYTTDTNVLNKDSIIALIDGAKDRLESLCEGLELRLKQDACNHAISNISEHLKRGTCIVSIGERIHSEHSSIPEIKKNVRRFISEFKEVVFMFHLRTDEVEEGLSSLQDVKDVEDVNDVKDFLTEFQLSTFFWLKHIKEGIHRSAATIKVFEYLHTLINWDNVTLTALSEKASLQPLLVSSFIAAQNTSKAVQLISEKLETTYKMLREVGETEHSFIKRTVTSVFASATTQHILREICLGVQIDLEEGTFMRFYYPQYKRHFLEKVRKVLAERIVDSFTEKFNVEIRKNENQIEIEINPASRVEFVERVNKILGVVDQQFMSSYYVWQRVFGVNITSQEWRLEMAGKIKLELLLRKEYIETEVSNLYEQVTLETCKYFSECSRRLEDIAFELRRMATEMDISDLTEKNYEQYKLCRNTVEALQLPYDAVVTWGKKQDDRTTWISIRSEEHFTLPDVIKDDVNIEIKSFEESAWELDIISEECYKHPVNSEHIVNTINTYGPTLMQKHSNLTAISASSVKLNKEHKPEYCDPPWIVFFTKTKGIIPFGEKPFPVQLEIYSVDVIEGHCSLGTLPINPYMRTPLRMGCSIGIRNCENTGTIGPLVKIKGTNDHGFLTCRHVVSDYNPSNASSERRVVQPSDLDNRLANLNVGDDARTCGVIEPWSLIFQNIKVNHVGHFVDVAFVRITERDPDRPEFTRGEEMRIRSGMADLSRYQNLTVFKAGRTTGLTCGLYNFNGLLGKIDQKTGYLLMKNLCQIVSRPNEVFLDHGDSGCMIWKNDLLPGMRRTLTFFGMGIGFLLGSNISFAVPRIAIQHALPNIEVRTFDMPFIQDVEMQEDRAGEEPMELS